MTYDVVIVGAGASGCALANRLSEDPRLSVLLLERGAPAARPSTLIPRAFPYALREPLLRSYQVRLADGRSDYWVRGSALGGSTVVNGMMYLRGERSAYDRLEAAGDPGWGWDAFRAAYDEIESRFIHPSIHALNPLSERIADAVAAAGATRADDLNQSVGPRVGATPASIHRGLRRSAARAFLEPVRERPNLSVLGGVDVESLVWRSGRIAGVRARRGSSRGEIHARITVVCAGTIETPLLLERSGIGRAGILQRAGIDQRVESPNVGERVLEQRGHALQVRLRAGVPGSRELCGRSRQAVQAARFAFAHDGALARPAYDVTALLSTDGKTVDTQLVALPFALAAGALRPAPYPGIFVCAYRLHPSTTSSIHHDAHEPAGHKIRASYETTAGDVAAAQAIRGWLESLAFGPSLADLVPAIDPYASPEMGSAIYHAVGSAAMGPHAADVVDPDLRVRGAPGLRIADLSVLPFHTSGSTAAPAMAIGWLAAERILGSAD